MQWWVCGSVGVGAGLVRGLRLGAVGLAASCEPRMKRTPVVL